MMARYGGGAPRSFGKQAVVVWAIIFASLVVYWSGWPSVPYAVILVLVVFGTIYKVKQGFVQALWYVAYMLFVVLMIYSGRVGAKSFRRRQSHCGRGARVGLPSVGSTLAYQGVNLGAVGLARP